MCENRYTNYFSIMQLAVIPLNFLNYVVLDDEKLAKREWLLGTFDIR